MASCDNWRKAVIDESYRQTFLDGIDLGDKNNYISNLAYDMDQEILRGDKVAMRLEHVLFNPLQNKAELVENRKCRAKSVIIVYPQSFSCDFFSTYQDFMNTLLHHEGYHAMEMCESPQLMVYDLSGQEQKSI